MNDFLQAVYKEPFTFTCTLLLVVFIFTLIKKSAQTNQDVNNFEAKFLEKIQSLQTTVESQQLTIELLAKQLSEKNKTES